MCYMITNNYDYNTCVLFSDMYPIYICLETTLCVSLFNIHATKSRSNDARHFSSYLRKIEY